MSPSRPPEMLGATSDVSLASSEPVPIELTRGPAASMPSGPSCAWRVSPGRAPRRCTASTSTCREGADPREYPQLRAGAFSTFGLVETSQSNDQHDAEGLTAVFDITAVRDRLDSEDRWDADRVHVSFSTEVPGASQGDAAQRDRGIDRPGAGSPCPPDRHHGRLTTWRPWPARRSEGPARPSRSRGSRWPLPAWHPEWWVYVVAGASAVLLVLISLGAAGGAPAMEHHMHPGMSGMSMPSESESPVAAWSGAWGHWALMVGAMMLPVAAPHVRVVAVRSLWSRRHRSAGLFLVGYLALWLLAGAATAGGARPPGCATSRLALGGRRSRRGRGLAGLRPTQARAASLRFTPAGQRRGDRCRPGLHPRGAAVRPPVHASRAGRPCLPWR